MRHVLDRRIRLVLARLELLSYGAVASMDSSGGKGKPTGGDKPKGWRAYRDDDELEVPHIRFRVEYERAVDNVAREGVCEAAEAALKALTEPRKAQAKGETLAQLQARILKDGQGWSVKDAALGFRVTETFVRKVRAEGLRRLDDGRPLPSSSMSLAEMVEKGWAVRRVAEVMGWSVMTAQRRMAKEREKA